MLEMVTTSGGVVRVDETCPVDLIRRAQVAILLADREGERKPGLSRMALTSCNFMPGND